MGDNNEIVSGISAALTTASAWCEVLVRSMEGYNTTKNTASLYYGPPPIPLLSPIYFTPHGKVSWKFLATMLGVEQRAAVPRLAAKESNPEESNPEIGIRTTDLS